MREPLSLTVEVFRSPEIFSSSPVPSSQLSGSDSIQYFISTASIPQPAVTMALQRRQSFPCQPLDKSKDEIRLLQILPDLSIEGLVQCQLKHDTLSKATEHIALSYCWGDASITKDIVVNGIVVPVTTNLESALCHFRNPRSTSRWLWIDAICINQYELEEKGFQIQLMSRIYAEASEVLVWLGPDYLGTAKSDFEGIVDLAHSGSVRAVDGSDIRLVVNNPYWRRVWIIQEVSMGVKVRVQWGNEEISWEDLTTGLQRSYDSLREFGSASMTPFMSNSEMIINLKRFSDKEKAEEKISFLDAMVASRRSKSTEPRDRVLAILGLTADGQYILSTRNYFKPDFEISLEISSSLLRMYPEKLHHIFLKSHSKQKKRTPSWLPNWSNIPQSLPPWIAASPEWVDSTHEQGTSSVCSIYPTLKKSSVVRTSAQTHLHVTGKRIGLVGEAIDRCLLPLRPQYANHILQRTLEVIDLPFDTDDNIGSKQFLTRAHFSKSRSAVPWLGYHKDFKIGGHSLKKWASIIYNPVTSIHYLYPRQDRDMLRRFSDKCRYLDRYDMQLFTTSDCIIGLGPKDTQPGDFVYQLSGCVAILREHQDGYRMVGQAFVNVMNYAKISTEEGIKATNVPGYLPSPLLPRRKSRARWLGFNRLLKENYEPDLTNLKEEEIKLY
ncbi:hypothetical protein HYFRA_00001635 [Hymenoscyphus fraxineus]|uniref:Heterokaryon incompatibility domain-containing protein n=1 Tax=Hymenoscyphus fraxineus TaxID=746836 RepID=A0A9N9L589_9HELO|nr:hypothetical protein HYFRA_00001635 [Hymenoscyphus fraxineus]